jgi:protease-4
MAGKIWRILVGIKDGLVLILMLAFFGALYALLSASPYSDSAPDGALVLALGGEIVEQPSQESATSLLTGSGPATNEHRLRDIVHALDRAAQDDGIRAVALDLDIIVGGGQTAIANVGEALDRVRRAGKPVIAYATGYGDDGYQLAAHASEIWLDPMGGVVVAGPGGNGLYFGALMERIGVTANVYRVGAFKSAVEPYTRADMSPEARRAAQALADSLWQSWLQDVRQARPKAQIEPYAAATGDRIAAANGDMARAALAAGLIDKIGDRAAFGRRMAEVAGAGRSNVPGDFRAVRLDAYLADDPASRAGGEIAVVTVAGTIVDGEAGPGTAGAETIVANIERGLREGNMRALVVRVDSPGGSTTASERIRRSLLAVKARGIPVVVSFGSVAASGGYWIATAGDTILAEPSTITGSIGVFGILPSFEGALQRLGVGADGVRTTPLSGEPDLFNGPSPEADRLLQMGVENTYLRFIGLVAGARRMTPQDVHRIAQGRVWDGGTARQLRLVDRFGSLEEAVAEAARLARIDPAAARPTWLEEEPGLFPSLLRAMVGGGEAQARGGGDVFTRIARQPEALAARAIEDARLMMTGSAIQARCLECPPVAVPPASVAARPLLARLLGLAAF